MAVRIEKGTMAKGPQDRCGTGRRGGRRVLAATGVAASVAVSAFGAGSAQAATISACYNTAAPHTLQYLPSGSCPSGTTEVSWNQTGPQGAQGAKGLNFRGAWSASTSYAVGDAVTSGGELWYAVHASLSSKPPSTNWTLLAASGAQGAKGAQGAQGAKGAQGAQGVQGAQGAKGAQGAIGAQGPQGAQGPANGAQGAQGAQGAKGAQGVQGAQGAQGVQGAQGAQGPNGAVAGYTRTAADVPLPVNVATVVTSFTPTSANYAVNGMADVLPGTGTAYISCWERASSSGSRTTSAFTAVKTSIALATNGILVGSQFTRIQELCENHGPDSAPAAEVLAAQLTGVELTTINKAAANPRLGPRPHNSFAPAELRRARELGRFGRPRPPAARASKGK